MKIGLFGQFGSGNAGNDGSLEAMVSFFRQSSPDSELVCICSRPDIIERNYKLQSITLNSAVPRGRMFDIVNRLTRDSLRRALNFLQAIGECRKLDALVIPGTGILDDFQESPFGWPFVILRWCLAARLVGTRIAFVSVGAGPIRLPLSRRFMKFAARQATYRSYRDSVSKEFMRGIGFDVSNDPQYPDLAFKLPAPPEPSRRGDPPITVGVGVMAYSGWLKGDPEGDSIYRTYMKKLARFVGILIHDGYDIRLLTGDTDDWRAVEDIQAELRETVPNVPFGRICAERTSSLHDLMREIARTDLVVATRFHNVVCSLKLGRPVISLGYAAKNDVLLADMGLGDFCQHVETFDVDLLVQHFREVLARRESLEEGIRNRVRWYHAQLAEQDQRILQLIAKSPAEAAGKYAEPPEIVA